jgi:hypothetical protein
MNCLYLLGSQLLCFEITIDPTPAIKIEIFDLLIFYPIESKFAFNPDLTTKRQNVMLPGNKIDTTNRSAREGE